MEDQKKQLVDKLKSSANILVTVSANPTVDQLAACIGLTLILNKLDKRATAVFSGAIPSTIEFLKPEETIEKNTDSLRDFIIALDRSKADKLRYKLEDQTVRIFITPYRTALSEQDLEFSQGDFNVDSVVALGVHRQEDLDNAIITHGRILHDAIVMSINNSPDGNLGSVNWVDTSASSLSELVALLAKQLGKPVLDEQIATALLTGIVAATDRFRNEKTTAVTMSVSADLMAAGANQQLVATELESVTEPKTAENIPLTVDETGKMSNDASANQSKQAAAETDNGTLQISHTPAENHHDGDSQPTAEAATGPAEASRDSVGDEASIKNLIQAPEAEPAPEIAAEPVKDRAAEAGSQPARAKNSTERTRTRANEPPAWGGTLTASTKSVDLEPSVDPLSLPHVDAPMLEHEHGPASFVNAPENPAAAFAEPGIPGKPKEPETPALAFDTGRTPEPETKIMPQVAPTQERPPVPPSTPEESETLAEIEEAVHSPHLGQSGSEASRESAPDVNTARDEVLKALNDTPPSGFDPVAALNTQPPGPELHLETPAQAANPQSPASTVQGQTGRSMTNEPAPNQFSPADQPLDMPLPPSPASVPPTSPDAGQPQPEVSYPGAPPPVPPPMMPPFFDPRNPR